MNLHEKYNNLSDGDIFVSHIEGTMWEVIQHHKDDVVFVQEVGTSNSRHIFLDNDDSNPKLSYYGDFTVIKKQPIESHAMLIQHIGDSIRSFSEQDEEYHVDCAIAINGSVYAYSDGQFVLESEFDNFALINEKKHL